MPNLDPSTKAMLISQGYNVEALYGKYTSGRREPQNHDNSIEKTKSSKLDQLSICKDCHGCGMVKIVYNHIVREQNCMGCDAEGLVHNG